MNQRRWEAPLWRGGALAPAAAIDPLRPFFCPRGCRAFYVNEESGLTSRAHPLDVVFQTVAAVERRRLEAGDFSLARAAALGEASGVGPSLAMRLVEEDGSAAYTFDWLQGRRAREDGASSSASPLADIQRQLSLGQDSAASGLTIKTSTSGP